jgi:hypothetical protein
MKPREEGGVVDSKLNVYGISRLKVAGVSIQQSATCELFLKCLQTYRSLLPTSAQYVFVL